jgi:hypothetical protein
MLQHKRLSHTAILVFVTGITVLQAQDVIPVSGGNATGTGGTVNYTIGQIVCYTGTGTLGTIAQGVQQPYEISLITGLEEAKEVSLEIEVFPNPTMDIIRLKIGNYSFENLRFELYSSNGTLLLNNKIDSQESNISMDGYIPSVYLLKVVRENKEIKTFKIIKK